MSLSAPVRDELVELLATYFSGSNVAAASIGLELGGHARLMAQPFFALREALGVTGYASRDEIVEALTASQVEAGEVERLNDWLAETQMLAHKWMVAHDKLKAGKPYNLPKPADLPDAIERNEKLVEALSANMAVLRRLARGLEDESARQALLIGDEALARKERP